MNIYFSCLLSVKVDDIVDKFDEMVEPIIEGKIVVEIKKQKD
jgi:hypothetical protein